jgi:hypothetical protein
VDPSCHLDLWGERIIPESVSPIGLTFLGKHRSVIEDALLFTGWANRRLTRGTECRLFRYLLTSCQASNGLLQVVRFPAFTSRDVPSSDKRQDGAVSAGILLGRTSRHDPLMRAGG